MRPDKVKHESRGYGGDSRGSQVDRNGKDRKAHKSSSSGSSSGRVKKEATGSSIKREAGDDGVLLDRKPGQKYATPTPGYPEREFYESLLKQKPESTMAQDWCLAYGVCGAEEAQILYKKACKRKDFLSTSQTSPVGSPKKTKSSSSGATGRPRSKQSRDDMDADTGFDAGNIFEGVGRAGL